MEFIENSPEVLCQLVLKHQQHGTWFEDFDHTRYDPVEAVLLALDHTTTKNEHKALYFKTLKAVLQDRTDYNPNETLQGSQQCGYSAVAKSLPRYAITTTSDDELVNDILLTWQASYPFNGPKSVNPVYLLARAGNYSIANNLISAGVPVEPALLTQCVMNSIPTKIATASMSAQYGGDFIQFSMGELTKMCVSQHIDPSLPIRGQSLFDLILDEGHVDLHQSLLGLVLDSIVQSKAEEMKDVLSSLKQSQPELESRLRVRRHF